MTDDRSSSPSTTAPPALADAEPSPAPVQPAPQPTDVILYGHSTLFYWWPVWVVGYALAGLTWWYGEPLSVGGNAVRLHHSGLLGVVFFLTLFLVIVITNVSVRGAASLAVVLGGVTLALLFLVFGWWQPILGWFGDLNVYLNQGGYFWFSTLLFAVWAGTVFGVDRMTHWRVSPGQLSYQVMFGAASRSYDATYLVVEKRRDDVFRHLILGFGSGDLRVRHRGSEVEDIRISNVLFVRPKLALAQKLLAVERSTVVAAAGG